MRHLQYEEESMKSRASLRKKDFFEKNSKVTQMRWNDEEVLGLIKEENTKQQQFLCL